MTEKTPKYGKANCGKNEKQNSCGKTLHVAVVEVKVKFPIIPNLKCMENPNISTYPIHSPTATGVIQVSIPESSSAQYAEKLFQNKRVRDALHALRLAISSALNPGPEPEETVGQGRESTSKPESGSLAAQRIRDALTKDSRTWEQFASDAYAAGKQEAATAERERVLDDLKERLIYRQHEWKRLQDKSKFTEYDFVLGVIESLRSTKERKKR